MAQNESQLGGMLALRRPIKGLTHLRQFDPHLSDLAGVVVGAKPALYTDFVEGDWPYIRRLCEAFRLKMFLPERDGGKTGFHHDQGKRALLLGRSETTLRKTAVCWGRDIYRWGLYLGYPSCCVQAYGDWRKKYRAAQPVDIVRQIYEKSDGRGPFSFLLNNLTNYYSRIDPNNFADHKRYAAMRRISFLGLDTAALNVASWHPCSYRCQASIKKARGILEFFKEHLPQWAQHLEDHLANLVVYFDKYEFAVLRRAVTPAGRIEHRGVRSPFSLLSPDILQAINRNRTVIVRKDHIRAEPEGIRLSVKGKKPLLLDFRPASGVLEK